MGKDIKYAEGKGLFWAVSEKRQVVSGLWVGSSNSACNGGKMDGGPDRI